MGADGHGNEHQPLLRRVTESLAVTRIVLVGVAQPDVLNDCSKPSNCRIALKCGLRVVSPGWMVFA